MTDWVSVALRGLYAQGALRLRGLTGGGRRRASLPASEGETRSAFPRVAYQPGYLVLDYALDQVRQVGVEPFLQERPQHLAHHVLDGPLSFAQGDVAHAFLVW